MLRRFGKVAPGVRQRVVARAAFRGRERGKNRGADVCRLDRSDRVIDLREPLVVAAA